MKLILTFFGLLAVSFFNINFCLFGQEVVPVTPQASIKSHLVFAGDKQLDVSSAEGVFPLVSLPAQQTVFASLAFPEILAGQIVSIETPDGGTASLPANGTNAIAADGTVTFSYTSGTQSGVYRIWLVIGEERWTISYSAPDLSNPGGNPAALEPGDPITP